MQTPQFLSCTTFPVTCSHEVEVIYFKNPALKPKTQFCEPDSFCCLSFSFPLICLCLNACRFLFFISTIIEMMCILSSSCTNFQPMSQIQAFLLIPEPENQKLGNLYVCLSYFKLLKYFILLSTETNFNAAHSSM